MDTWGLFHKVILATIDLSYLRLILQLPALIFTSFPQNNFKTIVNPTHVELFFLFHLTGCSHFVFIALILTPNSQSVYRAGVLLNIHSFIHSVKFTVPTVEVTVVFLPIVSF